jgi:hypothetical protein
MASCRSCRLRLESQHVDKKSGNDQRSAHRPRHCDAALTEEPNLPHERVDLVAPRSFTPTSRPQDNIAEVIAFKMVIE